MTVIAAAVYPHGLIVAADTLLSLEGNEFDFVRKICVIGDRFVTAGAGIRGVRLKLCEILEYYVQDCHDKSELPTFSEASELITQMSQHMASKRRWEPFIAPGVFVLCGVDEDGVASMSAFTRSKNDQERVEIVSYRSVKLECTPTDFNTLTGNESDLDEKVHETKEKTLRGAFSFCINTVLEGIKGSEDCGGGIVYCHLRVGHKPYLNDYIITRSLVRRLKEVTPRHLKMYITVPKKAQYLNIGKLCSFKRRSRRMTRRGTSVMSDRGEGGIHFGRL